MHHRVLHIQSSAFLHLHLKGLQIVKNGHAPTLIPFEDIGFIVLDGPEITLTAQLASALAEANIGLLFTAENHLPAALLQPYSGNSLHAETLRQQAACSVPKQKRVWQQIVQAKIAHQASLLAHFGLPHRKVQALVPSVLSGDSSNREGYAAALYWAELFGNDFMRERSSQGTNAMLNYGYAVLRAMVARALTGAGFHPALGIFHHNRYNPFALADDAIEPLRPMVYHYLLHHPEPEVLTPTLKRYLVQITVLPVEYAGTEHHILSGLERYAASLRRGICEDARKVTVPTPKWSAVIDKCGSW